MSGRCWTSGWPRLGKGVTSQSLPFDWDYQSTGWSDGGGMARSAAREPLLGATGEEGGGGAGEA